MPTGGYKKWRGSGREGQGSCEVTWIECFGLQMRGIQCLRFVYIPFRVVVVAAAATATTAAADAVHCDILRCTVDGCPSGFAFPFLFGVVSFGSSSRLTRRLA